MSSTDNHQAGVPPPPPPPPFYGVILDPAYNATHASRMLQCMIEEIRQYFSNFNLARLVFHFLSDAGMTFYRTYSSNTDDECFVPASNDEVIECIRNALVMGYGTALQLFHDTYATRAQQTTRGLVDLSGNREMRVFVNELINCDDAVFSSVTTSPHQHFSSSSAADPVPNSTVPLHPVLLDPRHGQLPPNTILEHVTGQVRDAFSASNLVDLMLQRAAQQGISSFYSGYPPSFSRVSDYQVRAFLEQAFIHGYTPAVQEFHDCALQVEAAALAGPRIADDHSLGSYLAGMDWEDV